MDMEDLALDALDAVGTAANPVEVVELQLPQRSFNLRNILYRTRSLIKSVENALEIHKSLAPLVSRFYRGLHRLLLT